MAQDNKYSEGEVFITKGTTGAFYINISRPKAHSNSDSVCHVTLDATAFANAITGKHVKASVSVFDAEACNGSIIISKSTLDEFYIEVELANGDQICQAVLTPEVFARAVTGEYVKADVRVYKAVESNEQ
jgi:hypothetical protein